MEFGYTQMAGNAVLSLLDKESFTIWERIEYEKNENDAELWRNKFSHIAEEYALSSRYALMYIILKQFLERTQHRDYLPRTYQN